jgi:hypothetical protein
MHGVTPPLPTLVLSVMRSQIVLIFAHILASECVRTGVMSQIHELKKYCPSVAIYFCQCLYSCYKLFWKS